MNVRKALNYAVDKDLIIEQIYGGRAVPLPGALSPYNSFANQSLSPYPYDTAMATDLLSQAGWTDSDSAEKCSAIFPDPILLEFEKVSHLKVTHSLTFK